MQGLGNRKLGWLLIVSGILAFIGFGLLAAALAAPPPNPGTLRRSEDLFRWQDAGVLLQALTMIPIALGLGAMPQASGRRMLTTFGLMAQVALVSVLVVRFANLTSDGLYMIPQGLVGLWLILFSVSRYATLPKVTSWIGIIAGFGLVLVGAGELIYGVMVAPNAFLGPLTDAEIDAQTWTMPNVVAHICMAAGTLLGRAIYPAWLVLLGVNALRRGL